MSAAHSRDGAWAAGVQRQHLERRYVVSATAPRLRAFEALPPGRAPAGTGAPHRMAPGYSVGFMNGISASCKREENKRGKNEKRRAGVDPFIQYMAPKGFEYTLRPHPDKGRWRCFGGTVPLFSVILEALVRCRRTHYRTSFL